jgi:hypothetical protein
VDYSEFDHPGTEACTTVSGLFSICCMQNLPLGLHIGCGSIERDTSRPAYPYLVLYICGFFKDVFGEEPKTTFGPKRGEIIGRI